MLHRHVLGRFQRPVIRLTLRSANFCVPTRVRNMQSAGIPVAVPHPTAHPHPRARRSLTDIHCCVYCRSVEVGVSDFAFSHSGRLVFCGNHNGDIVVWDALRAEMVDVINAHESRINSLSKLCALTQGGHEGTRIFLPHPPLFQSRR